MQLQQTPHHIITTCLDELGNTTKDNIKVNILKMYGSNPKVKQFLFLTLNPFLRYNIALLPAPNNTPLLVGGYSKDIDGFMKFIKDTFIDPTTPPPRGNTLSEILGSWAMELDDEHRQLAKILVGRDLRCGVGVVTVNKIFKKLIPVMHYQRCSTKLDRIQYPASAEIKHDGMFSNTIIENEGAFVRSRTGQELDNILPHEYGKALSAITPNTVLHGEINVYDGGVICDREEGNGHINAIKQGRTVAPHITVAIKVWDIIPIDDFNEGVCELTLTERRRNLVEFFTHWDRIKQQLDASHLRLEPVGHVIVNSEAEVITLANQYIADGLEGLIVKDFRSTWKGTNNHTCQLWVKVKEEHEFEMRIIGITEGKGKYAPTFGALMVESQDGGVVGKISGMEDGMRHTLYELYEQGLLFHVIVGVKANACKKLAKNKTFTLTYPRFMGIREDKSMADDTDYISQLFVVNQTAPTPIVETPLLTPIWD